MRRAWLYLALIAAASCTLAVCAARVGAQQPDCNLAAKRFDNPFSDTRGWEMRRYQWHVAYATASTLAAEGIHRATKMPRWASAVTATVLIGFVPHIRGVMKGTYPLGNARDWAFDGVNRAAPLIIWVGISGHTWQSRTLAATTIVGAYFSLACWASP